MNGSKGAGMEWYDDQAKEIEELYNGLLERLKQLSGRSGREAINAGVSGMVEFIIEKLSSVGEQLLLYTSKIFDEDYIYAHSLNVCIIAVRIGQKMGLGGKELAGIGFAALVHAGKDIGLPEGLSERAWIGEKEDEMIRLADVYDALTHPPAYRHKITPCETLTSIIDNHEGFDPQIVKTLLQELSLYPKGSWLQLSTNEIGKVIEPNRGNLLRPVVDILSGRKRMIDLSKNMLVHIKRPLTEEEAKRAIDDERAKSADDIPYGS